MKPENIKFACICPTYNRPKFLPEAIESFLRQTHRHRELIIIDDADQYEPQSGDRWRLIPFAERFPFVYDKYSFGILEHWKHETPNKVKAALSSSATWPSKRF